jgi:hypothetical protein
MGGTVMATLTNCKTCKKEISRNAKSCPHCGEPLPRAAAAPNAAGMGCAVIVAIIIVIAVISQCSSPDKSKDAPTATSSSEPSSDADTIKPQRIVDANRFGCTDRDYYEKIGSYAAQKDTEAFKQALSIGVLNGTCVLFTANEPVYLADTAIFSGLVKVRRPGEMNEYWTNMEAVSNNK